MNIENLSTLKIHKLTQEQYDRELESGNIDPSALYLTPDDNNGIYIQDEEPIDAENGSLWVDLDADGNIDNETNIKTDVAFYITLTGAEGSYTADKTVEEFNAAYEAGQLIYCKLTASENGTSCENVLIPFICLIEGTPVFCGFFAQTMLTVAFGGEYSFVTMQSVVTPEELPEQLPNPNTLTFNGAVTGTYNGSSPVTITIPTIAGEPGQDGYTPVKGVDYWTEEDQESMVQQVIEAIGADVFGAVDENNNIVLAGNLEYGTYVLKYTKSNGDVVTIGTLENTAYTNRLPQAIGTDGTLYNGGQGWKTGYRLNSSGEEAALDGMEVTGFIPCAYGDTVYLKDVGWDIDSGNMTQSYLWAYDANFTPLSWVCPSDINNGYVELPSTASVDSNGCLTKFVVDSAFLANTKSGSLSNVAYIRLNCENITNASVITVNEQIE